MTFYLKYVGSTLVEELEEGESYGHRVSKNAIATIVNMVQYFCSSHPSVRFSGTFTSSDSDASSMWLRGHS